MSPRALFRSPRFVVRVMAATFVTVAIVLVAVSAVLTLHTRTLVERGMADKLAAGQTQLALFEKARQEEALLRATVVSENPTLKAALDTFETERLFGDGDASGQARATVHREAAKLASLLDADVLSVLGGDGRVTASAGSRSEGWTVGLPVGTVAGRAATEIFIHVGREPFRATLAPIAINGVPIATLAVATAVDQRYAEQLSRVARTGVAVVVDGRIVASTMDARRAPDLADGAARGLGDGGELTLAGERHAYRLLRRVGAASFYAIDSLDAATAAVTHDAVPKLAAIAVGALLVSLLASARLARTISAPIDQVSRTIAVMADAQSTARLTVPPGSTLEIERLGSTFNRLMQSVQEARAETDAAYLGAIRALAAALDARDPYTAGHSERVSALAVEMGRHMGMTHQELDVLRLGALLHDIGKIGISDLILGKPGALTADEYEVIKTHPLLGAQILRPVAFLERHIPIVELHHEQPDGRGYPHGLRSEAIPLEASIVHVADAFDAITSARAYRLPRSVNEAVAELWRHAGSGFDVTCLQALTVVVRNQLGEDGRVRRHEEPAGADVLRFERKVS